MSEGLENWVVLHRELKALGYDGGYSILKSYVSPRQRRRQPDATMRFKTAPGEQAQVDWGSLAYLDQDGRKRRIWVFVMTLGWSRAGCVELVRRADTAAFIQCHVNVFEYLGGVPRRRLYDNAKVLAEERPHLGQLPGRGALAPYLREDRKVARDGFVSWEGSRYGVHWKWAGRVVQAGQRQGTVEIWAGDERIAVHPRAQKPGQRFIMPGQWEGLPQGDNRPRREAMAMAVQLPEGEVERRSLDVYELAAVGGAG